MAAESAPDRSAASGRESGLTAVAVSNVRYWFARRHRGELEHTFAWAAIRDGQFWLRLMGRKVRRAAS